MDTRDERTAQVLYLYPFLWNSELATVYSMSFTYIIVNRQINWERRQKRRMEEESAQTKVFELKEGESLISSSNGVKRNKRSKYVEAFCVIYISFLPLKNIGDAFDFLFYLHCRLTLGERVEKEADTDVVSKTGSAKGNLEMTFTSKKVSKNIDDFCRSTIY